MAVPSGNKKRNFADVWCRRCGHASRFGQWVAGGDQCPYCAGLGENRLPWILLRLQFPYLPLRPVIGQVYQPHPPK